MRSGNNRVARNQQRIKHISMAYGGGISAAMRAVILAYQHRALTAQHQHNGAAHQSASINVATQQHQIGSVTSLAAAAHSMAAANNASISRGAYLAKSSAPVSAWQYLYSASWQSVSRSNGSISAAEKHRAA